VLNRHAATQHVSPDMNSIKNEQLGAGGSGRQGGGIGAYADSRRSKSALPVSNTLHSGGAAPVFSLKI
jgi:hypothetical protein